MHLCLEKGRAHYKGLSFCKAGQSFSGTEKHRITIPSVIHDTHVKSDIDYFCLHLLHYFGVVAALCNRLHIFFVSDIMTNKTTRRTIFAATPLITTQFSDRGPVFGLNLQEISDLNAHSFFLSKHLLACNIKFLVQLINDLDEIKVYTVNF